MTKDKWRLPDILYCWFILSLLIPNVALSVTENMSVWARIANVALPLGILGWLASRSPKIGRTVWLMFPFVFLAAFQIVLLGLYGRSVISVDMFLNVVTTNGSEVGELLASLWPSLILVGVLYIPSLVLACVLIKSGSGLGHAFRLVAGRLCLGAAAVGLVSLGLSFSAPGSYALHKDLYPVNAGYNVYLAVDRTLKTSRYADTSADYTYGARSVHPDSVRELYVMVVGETSRAADWQLMGYSRPTNPRLSCRDGLICGRKALSESNTTHKSVPMLMSPVEAVTYDTDIYKVKSIITAFKEAGFETAFISNQRPNRSFIDFFGEEADTTLFVREQPGYVETPGDFVLLKELDTLLAGHPRKLFAVLHCYGSHFNYCDRYGAEDAHFGPCDFSDASAKYRDQLVNAYDNTIVATDRFLDGVIARLAAEDAEGWMIYTSDHGEDIFDNGSGKFLHASPMPSVHQVKVPLLAWLSDSYRTAYPDVAHSLSINMEKLISTSRSFAPTALTLGGLDTPRLDQTASLGSPRYIPRTPLYLNDHNEAVSLTSLLK